MVGEEHQKNIKQAGVLEKKVLVIKAVYCFLIGQITN